MMSGFRTEQPALEHDVPPCLGRNLWVPYDQLNPPDITGGVGIHDVIRFGSNRHRFVEDKNSRPFNDIVFRIFSVSRRPVKRFNDNNAGQTDDNRLIFQKSGRRDGCPSHYSPNNKTDEQPAHALIVAPARDALADLPSFETSDTRHKPFELFRRQITY